MKPLKTILILAGLSAGLSTSAAQPAAGVPTNPPPAVMASTNAPAAAGPAATATAAVAPAVTPAVATNAAPEVIVADNSTNGLRINFRGAPLNLVLDYLSDAAGFIINKRTDVRGTVEVWSKGPVTKDEAVELLNSVLKQNGYAVTRNNRVLTIISLDTANKEDTKIISGNNPDEAEGGDEVVTQIIPVRYASASQLVANLNMLLPTSATLTVNESANTLILVATKTDIKRMLKIIYALDTSIASVSTIKVIPLQYADAKDTATLITALFTPQTSNQGGNGGGRANLFNMLAGGRGGFGGGGFGGGGFGGRGGNGGGGGSTGAGGAAATRVTAVADDRSNSLVVSAPADLLSTIEEMVQKIDQEVVDVSELRVFRLVNADPAETADQLSQLFPDPTATGNGNQSAFPFFFGGRGGGRGAAATSPTGSSDRVKKMGRVLAVPDPRTGSLIVTASKTLMPQIADMVAELDSTKGRKEFVGYYELKNADPQDVYVNLQDLFQRTTRVNNNNSRSFIGNNNPLTQRETQNTQSTSSSTTGFGTGSSRGGGSMGGSGF
jgi:general secretion pathway protein D